MEEIGKKKALVIGGTSGLGREIGLLLFNAGEYDVTITGRTDEHKDLHFEYFNANTRLLSRACNNLVSKFDQLDLVVYAAGFYQEGTIDQLDDDDMLSMVNVGVLAPAMLLSRVMSVWQKLPGLIMVTSTSEWIPRLAEPVYAASKRGMAGLAESLSLDPRIGKVLVVGPARMNTGFWKSSPEHMEGALSAKWVAEQTLAAFEREFHYAHIKVLRDPPRIEDTHMRTYIR